MTCNKSVDFAHARHGVANFSLNYVVDKRVAGKLTLGRIPSSLHSNEFNDRVAIFSCGHPECFWLV